MKKVITFFLAFLVPLAAFSKTAKRIVCLSPSGAEILCEIGAEKSIVSRTDFCDYPEKIRSVPSIGGFDGRTFSIESILSCKPDFVYGSKGMHDFLAPVLAKHKIELFLSTATSIQDLKNEIQYIGEITGCEKKAKQLNIRIDQTRALVIKKTPDPALVYWEVWSSPYMSIGKNSYISELISICGGSNIFDSIEDIAYPTVNQESIITSNPDIIFIQSDSKLTVSDIKKRPGWNRINAVKNNQIYIIDSDTFSRPGPRTVESMKILSDIIGSK